MKNSELFNTQAKFYSEYRPTYPQALIEYISGLCEQHELVWDVATGNGQAAFALAEYFKKVYATDISEGQLKHAKPCNNIQYAHSSCENSTLEAASVDLVTVAQAIHWFDFEKFYQEVARVIKLNGVLAAWGYALMLFEDKQVQNLLEDFYSNNLSPYWAPERKHLDNHYDSIFFPFEKITAPEIQISFAFNFEQFIGYLNSWSAVNTYIKQHAENPIEKYLMMPLKKIWGDPQQLKKGYFPIYSLITRFDLSRIDNNKSANFKV